MTGNLGLIEQYRQMHAVAAYGNTSVKNLRFLRPEIKLLRPRSIIDYGCGQSRLLDELKLGSDIDLIRYDPAIPAFAQKPRCAADLLISIDVLEHIAEQDLDLVIGEMASFGRHAIIIVDTKLASAVLPDGRNAHVTIRPHLWWKEQFLRHFPRVYPIATARSTRAGFRTWDRGVIQTLSYSWMRASENARYYANRFGSHIGQRQRRASLETSL